MSTSSDQSTANKKLNLERASNFMRQYRDPDSRELKKLSANQFMEVWSHYDKDGNSIIIIILLRTNNNILRLGYNSSIFWCMKYLPP